MKKKTSELLTLIFIMIFMVGMYVFFIAASKESTASFAKGGILNLKNWDWLKNKSILVNGEWTFYPNLLKEDIDNETPSLLKKVPHFWDLDSDLKYSPYGFGTYKLKITGLKPMGIYGIEMPSEVTAYALFMNNEKVAWNGIVSKKCETYVPQWHPITNVFQVDKSGDVELVMEISNFDYYRGGFWNSIKIGNVKDILDTVNKDRAIDMFLFSTIFFVGFFSLGLFIAYKRNKTTLYFALFCLSLSFRTLLRGQTLIMDIISKVNWHILIRLEFLFCYLVLPLFALFTIHLFKVKVYSTMMKCFFQFIIFCCFFITLIMPNHVYSAYIEPYKWSCVLFGLYVLYLICRSVKKRQEGVELMLLGALGIMISILREIFSQSTVSWIPFASLNFVIGFSLITFKQAINAIKKNDILEARVILDPLTGLYNRNYLMEFDENYFKENEDQKKYVMFLDLDYFKYINDTFGHKTGDFILQETGKRLKNILRNIDIICRYGGDEFIIIVITDGIDDIRNIAEGIIRVIQKPFEKDGSSYDISVSIGIAKSNDSINNIEALIKNSDAAMYEAKKNGRNQYFLWNEI